MTRSLQSLMRRFQSMVRMEQHEKFRPHFCLFERQDVSMIMLVSALMCARTRAQEAACV